MNAIKSKFILIISISATLNILFYIIFFIKNSYLPSPFVFDKSNTLMDFYYPLFWLYKNEFYSTYQSVYPPINFYIFKIFTLIPNLDVNLLDAYELRAGNHILSLTIIATYFLTLFICINTGRWNSLVPFRQRLIIYLVILCSAPFLFTLERGNIIIFGLLFFSLYLSSNRPSYRALCLAILVNIKPYFIIFLVPELVDRNNRNRFIFLYLVCCFLLFFGLGYCIDFNFYTFIQNYVAFSKLKISPDGIVSLPHSLAAIEYLQTFITPSPKKWVVLLFGSFFWINLLAILSLIYFSLKRTLTKSEMLIACTILLSNCFIGTGGYILLYYIPIIPLLMQGRHYKIIFLLGVIFLAPIDWISISSTIFPTRTSYLGGDLFMENTTLHLSLGSIVRPLCNFTILITYTYFLKSLDKKLPRKKLS